MLTQGRSVLYGVNLSVKYGAINTSLNSLVCRGPGLNQAHPTFELKTLPTALPSWSSFNSF